MQYPEQLAPGTRTEGVFIACSSQLLRTSKVECRLVINIDVDNGIVPTVGSRCRAVHLRDGAGRCSTILEEEVVMSQIV